MKRACLCLVILGAASFALAPHPGQQQSERSDHSFTYVGQLEEGGIAYSGLADVRFTLWDQQSGGMRLAAPVTRNGIEVRNGVFRAPVDFPSSAFNGGGRWLEVSVRAPAGRGVWTQLQPRRSVTANGMADGGGYIGGGYSEIYAAGDRIINATDNILLNIDSNNNQTDRTLIIAKDRNGDSGGTELMRVQENGRVGIRVTSPAFPLDITSSTEIRTINALNNAFGNAAIYSVSNAINSAAVRGIQNTAGSYAAFFDGPGSINYFEGNTGFGDTAPSYGVDVRETADQYAVWGETTHTGFSQVVGTLGWCSASTNTGFGVQAFNSSSTGWDLVANGSGRNRFANPTGFGGQTNPLYAVDARAPASHFIAISGVNPNSDFGSYGIWGENSSANNANTKVGTLGFISSSAAGTASRSVWGFTAVGGGDSGYFSQNVRVIGTLFKGGGAFWIDHPLEPEEKYLYHSFVESPDMMNVYNGNITTDERGFATVQLPEWFSALNRDFRYQLTVIGTFAQAIIAEEIDTETNSFMIATDAPSVKVSWQVTGIRQDRYANANRIPTEVDKVGEERGRFLHPELFGAPRSEGIDLIGTNLLELAQEHEIQRLNAPSPDSFITPAQARLEAQAAQPRRSEHDPRPGDAR